MGGRRISTLVGSGFSRSARLIGIVLVSFAMNACERGNRTPASSAPATNAHTSTSAEPAPAGVRTFVIVPEESRARYVADEELLALAFTKFGLPAGWAKVVGTTRAIAGRFQIDTDNPTRAIGENTFTVRMNTFSTDREMRDNWIRDNGPRFNDYPEATFKATSIEGTGTLRNGEELPFTLHGNLTIRDVTKPAAFAVRATSQGSTLRGTATTRIKMSEFGIETITFYNTLTVADEIGLEVDFTARAES